MRALRFTLPLLALFFIHSLLTAQPRDKYGDPLPDGAKVRIGTTRMYKPGGGWDWVGVALTPDGKFLLSLTHKGAIERLDIATGLPVSAIGEKDPARETYHHIALSADGKHAIAFGGETVTVMETETGRELNRAATLTNPYHGMHSIASLSADGTTFAFAINRSDQKPTRQQAVVWKVGESKRRVTIDMPQDRYLSVALSPNGKILATWGQSIQNSGAAEPIQFWDATNGKKLGEFATAQSRACGVVFTPDGKSMAMMEEKGNVVLVDPKTGRKSKQLSVPAVYASGLSFSPDGKTLALSWRDGKVILWDVAADKKLSETKCPVQLGHYVTKVVFTDVKRAVAFGAGWPKAIVWEIPSGKVLSPDAGPLYAPNALAFTPDGKELLTSGTDGRMWTVRRWDPIDGQARGVVKFEPPKGIEVSPYSSDVTLYSSTKSLAYSHNNLQYIYDPRSGKLAHNLPSIIEEYKISKVEGGGVGGRLAFSGTRHSIRMPRVCEGGEIMIIPLDEVAEKPCKAIVRDLATGKKLCEIEHPEGRVDAAVRTRDGEKLITRIYRMFSNGNYRTHYVVMLWDLKTGKKLRDITEFEATGGWMNVVPHPNGKSVYLARSGTLTDGTASTIGINNDDTDAKNSLRRFDFATGKFSAIETRGLAQSCGPVFSDDGKQFAIALCDHRQMPKPESIEVRVYDAETGKLVKTFRGHKGTVDALAFSPDSKTLASGSSDSTVLLWDLTK